MKKLILVSFGFMLMLSLLAQAPDYFNYQAMLRNMDGTPMKKEEVSIQVDLLQGTIDGTSIYLESHNTETDDRGLVTLKIGDGTFFNEIDWERGPYYLSISVNGSHLGTSQLLSVPYALYAKNAGHVDDDDPDPTNEIQTLSIDNRILGISGGNTVELPDVTTPWQDNNNGIHYIYGHVGIGADARLPEVTLDIQKNISGGKDRALIRLRNTDEGGLAYVSLALEAYQDKIAKTFYRSELFQTSEYYDEILDFKGMCAVRAPGSGFSIFTESDYGSIRFYTTTVQDTIMERARFDPAGNLGIGTTVPKAKVHVADGDIYIEDINRGVIMQSPDGNHWRVTVNDGGTLGITPVSMK
ncbi:MAG: hypothetical protein KAR19_17550 [Bacteroidales bacterium]|nr:hypothetical protein [Bacteroidales bacterium]